MGSNPHVRFNDLTYYFSTRDSESAKRVLESGQLILGPEVKAFEKAWAERCGTTHAIGVANGMDAIEIGLRSLNIGPGAEVITTPMTAVATVLSIVRAGATPVLADIDMSTGLLQPDSVARCISPHTRAVLLVHLYGQMRDLSIWQNLCESHGLYLLEDCAQSHDAIWFGRKAGSWGEFGAYSFYPTKNLGASGDAGAIITSNDDVAERAKMLRNYGQANRYEHPVLGLNSRLDEMQAVFLSNRLHKLTEWTSRRQNIAKIYQSEISNGSVTHLAPPQLEENHVYHLFVMLTEYRDAFMAHLLDHGIDSLSHYPIAIQQQDSLRGVMVDPSGIQTSQRFAEMCVSIPCGPHLSDSDLERVINATNSFRP
jgi:dTDP-4-amino-4,6-dideoxygalactose transaminase